MPMRSRAARRWIAAAAIGVACAPSPGARAPDGAAIPVRIGAPPGVTVVSACTPTGPEVCFNAIDDNCNGLIDEGCGLNTGPLQFTIAWDEKPCASARGGDCTPDVDLIVTDPKGVRVYEGNKGRQGGLQLDRDCPSVECYGQNVENAFFSGGDPPRGRYLVEIKLTQLHGAPPPVPVRLGARVGARSYGADVVLTAVEEKKGFTFDL